MGFLYPRTISVYRDALNTSPGVQPYGAPNEATTVATGIPAAIQLKKESGDQPAHMPADVSKRTYWSIQFKGTLGLVQENDTITDDLGARYQVVAPYWNSLGYSCLCERLTP